MYVCVELFRGIVCDNGINQCIFGGKGRGRGRVMIFLGVFFCFGEVGVILGVQMFYGVLQVFMVLVYRFVCVCEWVCVCEYGCECVCEREGEVQFYFKFMEMGLNVVFYYLVVWEFRVQLAILKFLGVDLVL